MKQKNIFWRFLSIMLFLLAVLLGFMEYSSWKSVYYGHFGQSLDYDWAMRPWYLAASIGFIFSSLSALVSVFCVNKKKTRLGRISFFFSFIVSILILIMTAVILPYWYKHVQLLNYGVGG